MTAPSANYEEPFPLSNPPTQAEIASVYSAMSDSAKKVFNSRLSVAQFAACTQRQVGRQLKETIETEASRMNTEAATRHSEEGTKQVSFQGDARDTSLRQVSTDNSCSETLVNNITTLPSNYSVPLNIAAKSSQAYRTNPFPRRR
jgi:gas vesicle protein